MEPSKTRGVGSALDPEGLITERRKRPPLIQAPTEEAPPPETPGSGVTIEPLRQKVTSFIPEEAIEASRQAEKNADLPRDSDPFSEERVSEQTPPVDSSEETLGG